MLEHWKKHIYPKVERYCKGNLPAWEIEMGFAQISQDIITGNLTGALDQLYTLCDQRPPPDCDTATIFAHSDPTVLPMDEISIGMTVLANIKSSNNPNSVIFPFLKT